MQTTATYIGSEQDVDTPAPEKESVGLQDVFSRYLPLLYKTAYRYLNNPADAEDAVQDALLSAYKHRDQFRGEAQMSTWLVAIVSNCARMELRRKPRQMHESLDEPVGDEDRFTESEHVADCRPTPEEEYRNTELRDRILQFAEELSPTLRRAFQLRDLEGLTTGEAAQILGVVEGTAKAQIARARAKLILLLRRALADPPGSGKKVADVGQVSQPAN